MTECFIATSVHNDHFSNSCHITNACNDNLYNDGFYTDIKINCPLRVVIKAPHCSVNKICIWIPNCHRKIKTKIKIKGFWCGFVVFFIVKLSLIFIQKIGGGGEKRTLKSCTARISAWIFAINYTERQRKLKNSNRPNEICPKLNMESYPVNWLYTKQLT